ncbi:MAG: DNA-binding protein [Pseudomonadota bacterium]
MATGRKELTWLACDAIAAGGRKPSIASVREWTIVNHGRKQGSDTDTQADINAWYGVLLAMKQQTQVIAGLPESVAELARQLWIKASDAALEGLSVQRKAVDAELEKAQASMHAADLATSAALAKADAMNHELDVAQESIRRLEDALVVAQANMQAADARHALQIESWNERLAGLTREVTKKDAEQAARTLEIDGLRKHALLQIEDARAESRKWKDTFEAAATAHQAALNIERQSIAAARAALAGASGRLSAVEEALLRSEQRNAVLEQITHQRREQLAAEAASTLQRKPAMVRASKTMAFRRRKP